MNVIADTYSFESEGWIHLWAILVTLGYDFPSLGETTAFCTDVSIRNKSSVLIKVKTHNSPIEAPTTGGAELTDGDAWREENFDPRFVWIYAAAPTAVDMTAKWVR